MFILLSHIQVQGKKLKFWLELSILKTCLQKSFLDLFLWNGFYESPIDYYQRFTLKLLLRFEKHKGHTISSSVYFYRLQRLHSVIYDQISAHFFPCGYDQNLNMEYESIQLTQKCAIFRFGSYSQGQWQQATKIRAIFQFC